MAANNTTDANDNNPIYDYFGEGRFSPLLLGLQLAPFVVGVVAAVLNIALVIISLRGGRKALSSTFNRFLVILCVSDTAYELSQFYPMYLTLTGRNFTPLITCFRVQAVAAFCAMWSVPLLFVIALDRLFGVMFPTSRFISKWIYQSILVGASFAYTTVLWLLMWQNAKKRAHVKVTCFLADCFGDEHLAPMIFQLCGVFNVGNVLCYLIIWRLLKRGNTRTSHTPNNQICVPPQGATTTTGTSGNIPVHVNNQVTTQRVFKSLVAIMVVVIVGWLVNSIMHIVVPQLSGITPVQEFVIFVAGGCLVVTASGTSLPVLYTLR